MPDRHGLLAAGNFIIDHVKIIDAYPAPEMLANIGSQSSSNGGGPYNVLKDLAKMDAPFPLEAIGLIGNDADGTWIMEDCARHGIATWGLKRCDAAATSYTDAMTVASGGQRTFFHHRGANAVLCEQDIDLSASRSKWFYLGYLLLLDAMDVVHEDGTTDAGKALRKAKAAGFHTAADFVSVPDDRVEAIAKASLPHIDVLFINEIEAEMVTGLKLRTPDGLDVPLAQQAAKILLELGVQRAVVLHFQEGALTATREGEVFHQASAQVPQDHIVGSTGAGDAFAAGVLYGLHEDWDWPDSLELGVAAAAISLGAGPPSDAMVPGQACLDQARAWGFRPSLEEDASSQK